MSFNIIIKNIDKRTFDGENGSGGSNSPISAADKAAALKARMDKMLKDLDNEINKDLNPEQRGLTHKEVQKTTKSDIDSTRKPAESVLNKTQDHLNDSTKREIKSLRNKMQKQLDGFKNNLGQDGENTPPRDNKTQEERMAEIRNKIKVAKNAPAPEVNSNNTKTPSGPQL